METIKMKEPRLTQIKEGKKTSTLRDGKREYKLGKAVLVNSDDPSDTVNVTITQVRYMKLGSLPADVVKVQGYKNLSDLKKTMVQLYPNITDDSDVTHVLFTLN